VGDLRLILFGAVILLGPLFFPQGLVTAERLRGLAALLGRGRPRDRQAPQTP
jgi:branched-chain amino acid transport system permease protein